MGVTWTDRPDLRLVPTATRYDNDAPELDWAARITGALLLVLLAGFLVWSAFTGQNLRCHRLQHSDPARAQQVCGSVR